jgi:uncharacterized protein YjbI with pentapeptide repeats
MEGSLGVIRWRLLRIAGAFSRGLGILVGLSARAVRRFGKPTAISVGAILAFALLISCVLVFPRVLVSVDLSGQAERLSLKDLADATNSVRSTLLQGLAGATLLAGAFFTWRQLHLSRQGQLTERFTRAAELIGSDNLDVRLGAIHAFERIARDSKTDRESVAAVLAAYIRGHAPWQPAHEERSKGTSLDTLLPLAVRAIDVQTALTLVTSPPLSASFSGKQLPNLDLRFASLVHGQFRGGLLFRAHLERSFLSYADLEQSDFAEAQLQEARMEFARLRGARLSGANLKGAQLHGADLRGANLAGANLEGAVLRSASLEGADLSEANLQEANLSFANLSKADVDSAHLNGAKLDYCKLNRTQFEGSDLTGAKLRDVRAARTNFHKAILTEVNFGSSKIMSADLYLAKLDRVDFTGANLRWTRLDNANLNGARASSLTKWPLGFKPKVAGVEFVSPMWSPGYGPRKDDEEVD